MKVLSLFLAALVLLLPLGLLAQEFKPPRLYFVSRVVSAAPGSEIAVRLLFDSARPVNALSLKLHYPPEILKPLRINDRRSIIGVWPERDWQPVSGRLQLAGGLLQPFSGAAGEIIEIVFQATNEGRAGLTLTETAVYYADGLGTRVEPENETVEIAISRESPLIVAETINGQEPLEWQFQEPIRTIHPWRAFWGKLAILLLVIIILGVIIKKWPRKIGS